MTQAVLFALVMGWLGALATTVYAHRALAHRALEVHPAAAHVMRFLLWLTTGTTTRGWVAVHRKHHRYSDRPGDPHSPVVHGFWKTFFGQYFLYRAEAWNEETRAKYGRGCPDDWMERNVYERFLSLGLVTLYATELALFGWRAGAVAVLVQIVWMPLAAGFINGLGHHRGYRNFETGEASRNISPIGIVIGGEELHNNHHRYPRSAKFSQRWFEVDVGWGVVRALMLLGLARGVFVRDRPLDEGEPVASDPIAPAPLDEPA